MILNILKPVGITSHEIVNKIRSLSGERRVGHGGTLDPLAQGVLVIGIGRESTRKLHQVLKDSEKEYVAILHLGQESTTDDKEGEIKNIASSEIISSITLEKLNECLGKFRGEIMQTPPAYSALKIKGVPAYKLARRGKPPLLPGRKITIKELELLAFNPPLVKIRVVVSAGTYIRSLARDVGRALKTGAYLEELTRIRVGDFRIEDAQNLEDLKQIHVK